MPVIQSFWLPEIEKRQQNWFNTSLGKAIEKERKGYYQ